MIAEKEDLIERKNKELEIEQLRSVKTQESQLELKKEFDDMKI
jgi:hypothetical protein